MSWDGVPWAIGGGQAEHSANIARNVAYAAFGGREGIVSPADLEVRELAVPGTSVRVFPGTVAVKNRAAGVRDEMYVGRLPATDTRPIAPTGATARTDLIAAVVKDPYLPGSPWAAPATPATGPYIETVVISGVPSTTTTLAQLGLGYSGVALARITIPPSTGTITQAMITDLRVLSQTRTQRNLMLVEPTTTESLTSASFQNWPNQAYVPIDVPDWATHAKVLVHIGGVQVGGSGGPWNVAGDLRVQIGKNSGPNAYGPTTRYNYSLTAGVDRIALMTGAPMLAIPATLRGASDVRFVLEGRKVSGNTALLSDTLTMVSIDVEFVNARESNL